MDLIESLNKQQKEAVINTEGPMLVIAGAGSGKTKVLTSRIAYLIREKNVAPWNILAITFTNRAATEMKERLEKIIGEEDTKSVWVSTFHSTCVRILRRDIEKIGYTKTFTIYDDSDKKRLVRSIMKRLNLDEKQIKPRSIMSFISDAKNKFITPEEIKNESNSYVEQKKADVYAEYEKEVRANNALDFDDLLVKTLELLQKDKEVLEYYQNKFKYVLVDEYQDTNKVQYMIVKMIGAGYKNVFVVGDDDQSIYGWRGADISNILNFEKDYDRAELIRLEQNYRSTNNILNLANNVIKNNIERKEKNLWSENGEGDVTKIYSARDERDEARFVADEIKKLVDTGEYSYKDFAVMYRTNAQSRAIEEAISNYMMPYQVYGAVRFYDRKEVKDLIAYLNTIVNDKDSVSVKRIINVPKRKIGDTSIEKMEYAALTSGLSFYEVLRDIRMFPELSKLVNKVDEFTTLIEEMRELNKENKLTELVKTLIEKIDFEKMIREEAETDEEGDERMANVGELLSKISYFEEHTEDATLEKFLAEVMLMTDSDNMEESDNRLKLMTIHVAKGLEFRTVFLVGFEDGLFPSIRPEDEGMEELELEEERRLLYVAITRAKKELYISYANQRTKFGKTEPARISRFIKEFPGNLYEEINKREVRKISRGNLSNYEGYDKKPSFAQISSITRRPSMTESASKVQSNSGSINAGVNVGDTIIHKKYGKGIVKDISATSSGTPGITIDFEGCGEKKFVVNPMVMNAITKI